MKKALLAFVLLTLALIPVAAMQEAPAPRLEITGVNPTNLPTVVVTVNVYDSLSQPIGGLTAENFRLVGSLADQAQITSVRQVEDANLPVAVVLVIDVSSSMEGRPFEQAKEAARAFVNSIRENDPVAIMTFASRVQLVQDFTSNKATLLAAIDALPLGGQTSLYEGALLAVQKAAEAPSPRRAVILLSDGAQYDESGRPRAARGDAASEALIRGVPVYTIGLGYGIDRSFLIELSQNTNARNYESPSPEQLEQIYRELAALLRSQYEIVITANLPADGTEYDLQLEVTTAQGTATSSAVLRAPVPVPIITLPTLEEAISEPTEITATILADDGIASVDVLLDNQPLTRYTEEPYSILIDPEMLSPGQHTLSFTALDNNGDSSTAALNFEIAPLPSRITIDPDLPEGEISEQVTSGLVITGQTPAVLVTFSLDGVEVGTLDAPDYAFILNPFNLTPGEHTLTFTVLNEAGVTSTLDRVVTIADLPPQVEITGLEEGQTLSGSVEVRAAVISSQAQVTNIAFEINGTPLDERESGVVTLNAEDLQPGAASLTVTVENEIGQRTTETVNFEVAALPPQITISGVEMGETIEESRDVVVETTSQTPITEITFRLDGEAVAATGENTLTLDVFAIPPGAHILTVEATNEGGQSAAVDLPFIVGEGPSMTLTAMFTPSATPTPTITPSFTPSPTPTPNTTQTAAAEAAIAQATADASATAGVVMMGQTSTAVAIIDATSTGEAEAASAQATTDQQNAEASATAQVRATSIRATVEARQEALAAVVREILTATSVAAQEQATQNAPLTMTAQAEQATATVEAEQVMMTATSEAAIEQATVNAQLTQAALELEAQANAQATATVQTVEALLTATHSAADAQATSDARATILAQNAQATVNARQTALAQSARDILTQTREAANATATQNALATATAQAALTLTNESQQATLDALATATAQTALTLTNESEQATLDAQATATAQAALTLTGESQAATQNAQATTTMEAALTLTNESEQAALNAQATATAESAQATEETATPEATPSPEETEVATEEATVVVTEEVTEEATRVAMQVEDASATPTDAGTGRTPSPTVTPIGTLIPAQAETTPETTSILPIAVIIVIVVVLLLIVFLILSRARRAR